ncbi:hypothetical protein [Arenimonas daejeonensis]|uniref:hypothetical protein n=1 Tax=Arenimonas daejeonensis TaxID=370777 RepID=UPI001D1456FF|nr:hypothetical protein [Arenimonas daejeonensis]
MIRHPLLTGALMFALAGATPISFAMAAEPGVAATSSQASTRLHELFETDWQRSLERNPLMASYFGDPRYNDRWPDESPPPANATRLTPAPRWPRCWRSIRMRCRRKTSSTTPSTNASWKPASPVSPSATT